LSPSRIEFVVPFILLNFGLCIVPNVACIVQEKNHPTPDKKTIYVLVHNLYITTSDSYNEDIRIFIYYWFIEDWGTVMTVHYKMFL